MNPNDIPIVPNAMEASYKRRVRCVRLQSRFTHNAADTCSGKKVFIADDSLKTWLASGEAASIFWTHVLMPFIRSNPRWGCESFVQETQWSIARDSLCLRQKMTRLPVSKEDVSPPDAAHGAPVGASQTQWSRIVKETHTAARSKNPDQREWKRDILARLPGIQSNYGPHMGVGQHPRKLDVFELAIDRFPYLRKKTAGQRRNNVTQFKYSLRPLGLPIYEQILSDVSTSHGRTVSEVFGTWEDWGVDWEKTTCHIPTEDESREGELWEPGFFIFDEVVDIQSLDRYSNLRVDRRQQELAEYVTLHQTKGWIDDKGLSHIEQRYSEKIDSGPTLR